MTGVAVVDNKIHILSQAHISGLDFMLFFRTELELTKENSNILVLCAFTKHSPIPQSPEGGKGGM